MRFRIGDKIKVGPVSGHVADVRSWKDMISIMTHEDARIFSDYASRKYGPPFKDSYQMVLFNDGRRLKWVDSIDADLVEGRRFS